VRVKQRLERVVVFALDHDVSRFVAAAIDLSERRQPGIDRDAEVLDHD
jgi:hypothetical protein